MNASHLTVRNLPAQLATALEREKSRRGTSMNQTVIDLLELSLGVRGTGSNGVLRLAGTWTEAENQDFLAGMQSFEQIDSDLWA